MGRPRETIIRISNTNNKCFQDNKNYVPEDKKRMIYYAYIYFRIQYGIEMYGTASKKLMKKGTNKTEQSNKSAPQQKLLYADHTTP